MSKAPELIRDVDTGVLYLHARDTGIHPLIIAMGGVPVMISKNYPRDTLVKMSDAAGWHERESLVSLGKEKSNHVAAAQAMRALLSEHGFVD